MKQPVCLLFSPCDLADNDGFIGHLRMLIQLLDERKCIVKVVGYSARPPVVPLVYRQIVGSGFAITVLAALCFMYDIVALRPDVVVFTSAGALFNPLFALVARAVGSAVIFDCHDPSVETVMRIYAHSPLARILQPYLVWGDSIVASCATLTLSVSPRLTDLLRTLGWRRQIEAFYNVHNAGLHGNAASTVLRGRAGWEDATILIYVGNMQPGMRGLEAQFQAVRMARARGANVRFAVVCGSGDTAHFDALAEGLRSEDAYYFVRNIPPQEVANLIGEGNAAVHKALKNALPSKVFEYIANGLTILSVDNDSDVNRICGAYVTLYADTLESLTDALVNTHASRSHDPDRIARARTFINELLDRNRNAIATFVGSLTPR